ncbi:MAG: peptidase, partial [Candidatus Omnitrophica bacterium]|nr:peptidase [Candidatus Omnitrophota bacterium]
DVWLNQYSKEYGVSCEVILRRLLDEGRLQSTDYNAYRERLKGQVTEEGGRGNRQYRHREPIHMFGEKYVKTVLDALYAEQITLTKATNYLDSIKISDLHKLEGYYAGL